MVVGVLALQGAFAAHCRLLERLGAEPREVRTPAGLEGLDGLVLGGGESTAMALGIAREGLAEPLRALVGAGTPVLGTCAGMILAGREHLGLADWTCERNAFGRQARSFEAAVTVDGIGGGPLHAAFIRAPWVRDHGPRVEVLARVAGHPVAVRDGAVLAVAFHPELSGEDRLHRDLLDAVARRAARRTP